MISNKLINMKLRNVSKYTFMVLHAITMGFQNYTLKCPYFVYS